MLKDITLGQFFPGNTIVHRLDPRTKLMALDKLLDTKEKELMSV